VSRKPFRRLESLMGPVASNAELLFGRTLPAGLAERLVSGLRFARRAYIDWQTRSHLVSYPKCGRTWLRVMLSRAVLDAAGLPTQGTDLTKVQRLHRLVEGSPRVAVTHDDDPHRKTPDELETDKSAYRRRRVVLLVRDPRDVIVSQYHHRRSRDRDFDGSLSAFLRAQRGGYESLLRFYAIWWRGKQELPHAVVVRYEDLRSDPVAQLHTAALGLGFDRLPDASARRAVEASAFERMRRQEAVGGFASHRLRPGDPDVPNSFKVRKGQVGGFREEMSEEDVEWVTDRMNDVLPPGCFGYTTG